MASRRRHRSNRGVALVVLRVYGGSAIGGVVNVILRKLCCASCVPTYDARGRAIADKTVSLSYGLALEGGRTHVRAQRLVVGIDPLLLQDRRAV